VLVDRVFGDAELLSNFPAARAAPHKVEDLLLTSCQLAIQVERSGTAARTCFLLASVGSRARRGRTKGRARHELLHVGRLLRYLGVPHRGGARRLLH
jgi:hypothetical protein